MWTLLDQVNDAVVEELTLHTAQDVGAPIGGAGPAIYQRVPVAKLATVRSNGFQRDQRMVTLQFLWKPKIGWSGSMDGLRTLLQLFSYVVRDKIVERKSLGARECVEVVVELSAS